MTISNPEELFHFLRNGDSVNTVEDAKSYIDSLPNLNDFRDENGNTILIAAAESGQDLIVAHLLNKGALVNCLNLEGNHAITLAATNGHAGIVQTLLSRNVWLRPNKNHESPLALAIRRGDNETINLLLNATSRGYERNRNSALIEAASLGRSDIVQELLMRNVDVNFVDKNGKTALVCAINNGHMDLAQELLRLGASLKYSKEAGNTALIHAINTGRGDIVQRLLQSGADVNFQDKEGNTPLIYASRLGREDIVLELLEKQANVNIKNKRGHSALDEAKVAKNHSIIDILELQNASIPVDQGFSQGKLINIHNVLNKRGVCYGFSLEITRWALKQIQKGVPEDQINVMKKLRQKLFIQESENFARRLSLFQTGQPNEALTRVSINYKRNDFLNSLPDDFRGKKFIGLSFNTFSRNGYPTGAHIIHIRKISVPNKNDSYEVIDVNYGSKKCNSDDELNKYVETVLSHYQPPAYMRNNPNGRGILVHDLEGIVRSYNLLPDPILPGEPENIKTKKLIENKLKKYSLSKNSDFDIKDGISIENINKLLEKGVDIINYEDSSGNTLYKQAIKDDDLKLANFLVKSGRMNIDYTDQRGDTYLIYATKNTIDKELVQSLLEKGSNVNHSGFKGKTALMHAVRPGNKKIVELLVENGADVNCIDDVGATALIHLFQKNALPDKEIVGLLVENGADVNAVDKDGNNSLIYCSGHKYFTSSHEESMKLIIEKGANVNHINNDGDTPLIKAVKAGNKEAVELLIKNAADVNHLNNNGVTALDIARNKENQEIAQVLEIAKVMQDMKDSIASSVEDAQSISPNKVSQRRGASEVRGK